MKNCTVKPDVIIDLMSNINRIMHFPAIHQTAIKGISAMTPKTAVTALFQGEKIKAGIIWATEIIHSLPALPENEKSGAEKTVATLIRMIGYESVLARRTTADESWTHVEKDLDMALVMIHSGVSGEAAFHLTKALRHAVAISGKGLGFLVENGIM